MTVKQARRMSKWRQRSTSAIGPCAAGNVVCVHLLPFMDGPTVAFVFAVRESPTCALLSPT